jgi:hypothetical protein
MLNKIIEKFQVFLYGSSVRILLLFFLLFTSSKTSFSQSNLDYDELIVNLKVPKTGTFEVPIAIKEEKAYISIQDFFNLFKIKAESNSKKITGFLIDTEATYIIDIENNTIQFKNSLIHVKAGSFIQTPTTTYLSIPYFGEIFNLNLKFNIRRLDMILETPLELPIMREMRLRDLRENLNKVKGVIKPDSLIKRTYPFFKAGSIDWGVSSTQQLMEETDNRFNLGLGSMIAGGETNILLNHSTKIPFSLRNQFYQWKLVNNDSKLFKQVTAGKIFNRTISSLFAPVVGIQLTNTPVVNRRSFGTYTLNDITEPRWTVELYVNNVLIDYTQADDSGFYKFEIPLMYGNTAVYLKFYGPYGEERFEERIINIPYNFLPKNELEYTLSAGILEDDENNRFSRFNLNYGISRGWTIGGGMEYFSNNSENVFLPFLNTSIKLAPSLLLSGEYAYKVKAEGLLSFRTPRNFQIDFNYINYDKNQTVINYNYLEERKISMSKPFKSKLISGYSRFSVNQIILPTTEFISAQLLLSGTLLGVSTNLTTSGTYSNRSNIPNIYTTLSQSYRLPLNLLASPQVQYDYTSGNFTNIRIELERSLFKYGYANIGYNANLIGKSHSLELGFRYTFNFAQTSLNSRIGTHYSVFTQNVRGSFIFDANEPYVHASNRSGIGKGGIKVQAFLDLNFNKKWDEDEPLLPGVKLKRSGGRVVYNNDKTELRIFDIQPYAEYMLELDAYSLDNLAWIIEKPLLAVEIMPNQIRSINVPVSVMGEVSGMVYLEDNGIGRIMVNIFDNNNELIKSIMSEGDGYFSYLGLKPGSYIAEIDKEQLNKLELKSIPKEAKFTIEIDEYGDIVDDLEFNLTTQN